MLFEAEIVAATEQQPAGFPEHNVAALAFQTAGFLSANFVQRLVHIGDDMKAIEDV